MISALKLCPKCGTEIPSDAPEGGCAFCLLQAGIGGEKETTHDSTQHAAEGGLGFGVYEIDRQEDGSLYELGRGAMGVTYRATDTSLQRKVALKIIKTDIAERSADARERFMREARAAAALRHENIAMVHQFGMRLETGQYFYAMELIEGETLEERVRRAGPLDARTTIEIAQQVTSAIAAAEKHGLVHRDLKPANLMLVSPDGETSGNQKLLVKIIDFGLAKAIHTATDPKSLTHDRFVGTPAFASPEQFEHSALDVRSDIYSLGETLWFALTGKTSFGGRSVEEIHRAQQRNVLPIEQLKTAHVPSHLRSLLQSMLALEPASRPGTRELAAQLQRCSPEARKAGRTRVALAAAAILTVGTSALFFVHPSRIQNAALNPAPDKSIAVLPFTDLSPNHDQESFSDGMAEEILNALAHIKGLKVVGRVSSFFYKGKNVSLKKIGSELGVANILEGSVRKQGEQVRITSALTRVADGLQVWSKNYDGTLANIFDLQESFARDIAAELKVALADPSETRLVEKSTANTHAYTLFIEAQSLVTRRGGDSLRRAIALLEEATRLDPNFARAWAKLAVALAVEPEYANADWQTNWEAADKAAHRAIDLDPKNAEAYAALGYVDLSRRRYREMVEPAQRAVTIDPNDVTANFWLSNQLAAMGRTAEAETFTDRALNADPANSLFLFYKAYLRWKMGDRAAALKLDGRASALGAALGGYVLAFVAASEHNLDAGMADFANAVGALRSGFNKEDLETIYRGMYGDETARKASLAIVAKHPHEQFACTLLLMLGEPEQSFTSFEENGAGLSDAYLAWLWQPETWSRKARQHPAFQSFAKRIGMLDYWKQNRWPDLCQPAAEKGPDAFTCR
jgi:serine/threonine protein kinase/Flp pilus assembly protein TadD